MNHFIFTMEISRNKDATLESLIMQYLESLSEKEKKAYEIAKSHLGMSFQIEKANGFIKWKKEIYGL